MKIPIVQKTAMLVGTVLSSRKVSFHPGKKSLVKSKKHHGLDSSLIS